MRTVGSACGHGGPAVVVALRLHLGDVRGEEGGLGWAVEGRWAVFFALGRRTGARARAGDVV